MSDRPTDSLFPGEDFQEGDKGVEDKATADSDLEARIDDWATQNNAENISPCATLYRFHDLLRGDEKSQVNYYKGNIPTRHEIGEMYGGGRYMLVLTRPPGVKQPRKSTSYRFTLHSSYDRLRAERAEKEAAAMTGNRPAVIIQDNGPRQSSTETFKETFALMQGMMSNIFTMLSPLLNRAMEPRQIAGPSGNTAQDQIGVYAALKDILKTQTKADIDFFTEMKKGFMNMNPTETDTADPEEIPAEEKKSLLERILAIAEPFIPMLAQNTAQAKIAAAGIRAMPQVKAAVKQITASPDLLQKIVSYVEKKEGREGAIIALRNMGIEAGVSSPVLPPPSVVCGGRQRVIIKPKINPQPVKKAGKK